MSLLLTPHTSSDGGAVLLKAAEKVYGLVAGFVRCLVDRREAGKVRHTLADLLDQRIFGIACGHPDGNDAEHLADDLHPQAAARARPGGRRPPGLATDDLVDRHRSSSSATRAPRSTAHARGFPRSTGTP